MAAKNANFCSFNFVTGCFNAFSMYMTSAEYGDILLFRLERERSLFAIATILFLVTVSATIALISWVGSIINRRGGYCVGGL